MPMTKKQIIFITGGARSGKSSFALGNASILKGRKAYIATAEALDEEMKDRIEKHRRQRGKDWEAIEEPLKIAELIRKGTDGYKVVIIDCLTLWLSNIMLGSLDADDAIEDLVESLVAARARMNIYIVSNEVGMGIVPDNGLSRRFRDLAGILNRKVAEISDAVYLVVAGIPLKIK